MKRPNWRLFFLLNDIKLGISILALIGIVILSLFIFDKAFPIFKYSVLCLKIVTWICLILSLTILLLMVRKARKERFCSYSNRRKIVYSLSYLSLLLTILFSIEYLIYIENKNSFNIEKEYLNNSLNSKVYSIKKNIAYFERQIQTYYLIHEKINHFDSLDYKIVDGALYVIIQNDTLELKIIRKPQLSSNHGLIKQKENRINLESAYGIGVYLKDEFFDLAHPSSKSILESIRHNNKINSYDLQKLIWQKNDWYQNRVEKFKTILEKEMEISLCDFVTYNIFNPNITGNRTHIFIRLIFLLQAIVVTFFSGYIYQTLYKILDGKDSMKPEA